MIHILYLFKNDKKIHEIQMIPFLFDISFYEWRSEMLTFRIIAGFHRFCKN